MLSYTGNNTCPCLELKLCPPLSTCNLLKTLTEIPSSPTTYNESQLKLCPPLSTDKLLTTLNEIPSSPTTYNESQLKLCPPLSTWNLLTTLTEIPRYPTTYNESQLKLCPPLSTCKLITALTEIPSSPTTYNESQLKLCPSYPPANYSQHWPRYPAPLPPTLSSKTALTAQTNHIWVGSDSKLCPHNRVCIWSLRSVRENNTIYGVRI